MTNNPAGFSGVRRSAWGRRSSLPMSKTSTPTLALAAVLSWVALAAWLAGIDWQLDPETATPGRTPARMAQLAAAYGAWLWLPLPIVAAVFRLAGRGWGPSLAIGLRIVLIAWMAGAALWAAVGALAAANRDNPWEALPDVTPPYLEAFIAAHPQLEVETIAGNRTVYLRHSGKTGSMRIDGNLLPGTQARLERCLALPDPDDLGGLPLFPKSTCHFLLTLTRPGLPQKAIYAIALPVESDLRDRVKRHYLDWARAQKAEADFGGGGTGWSVFRASAGDRRWDFTLRGGATSGEIHVERGGRSVEWPTAQALRR